VSRARRAVALARTNQRQLYGGGEQRRWQRNQCAAGCADGQPGCSNSVLAWERTTQANDDTARGSERVTAIAAGAPYTVALKNDGSMVA
jgi:hypothetical protein